MELNGQWPYLKRQNWYTSGKYVIAVDINFYPDRSGHKGTPVFHKDSGGNNIFVNLIFDNQDTIEATEWVVDLTDGYWSPSRTTTRGSTSNTRLTTCRPGSGPSRFSGRSPNASPPRCTSG
jgi:hypothetical protein